MPKQRRKDVQSVASTRIDTLRQTYGNEFAAGLRGDAHLKTLLDRTGSASLDDYLKSNGALEQSAKNDRESAVKYASEDRFKLAHQKTSKLHAGLFRRLAQ